MKMSEEAKETPEDTPQSLEARSGPLVHPGFDVRLSGKPSPGYTKSSMVIDDVSRFWVLNCREPACYRELGLDDKYEHVARFLRAFLIQNLQCANHFLSKKSALFLRDMVCVYGTVDTVYEIDFVTELAAVWDKALQVKDGPLALYCFAQRHIDLLKQGYTALEGFADPT